MPMMAHPPMVYAPPDPAIHPRAPRGRRDGGSEGGATCYSACRRCVPISLFKTLHMLLSVPYICVRCRGMHRATAAAPRTRPACATPPAQVHPRLPPRCASMTHPRPP
ncbi:uncharacterized protein B0H18DRAFT_991395, partial [Fomitopsis serialis]|uniref:uncharacterized protein n=1 Tax=Fomitopsis serialis TaxID=139415 RepID=UPI0020084972